ncbi:hypothetical protein FJT64_017328 [Amphibalanus amphitrite]|uniref:Uncharacterized protein n=1 Tax=Amphibalanus amphitrite TaxID=1232801 RepID=A0A6A4WWK6_AMPAM|nr:hypothetical protein FJT64_017328 [Amphibalanus amphitrite]
MSEVAVQDDPASAASEQAEALVSAASRLEEVCRDLTTCLRALPSLTERRAAALCLRAAAVSGRLHLKEAIRFLDAAWADDRDGPLCPERRVVPETPERSPPAGRTDGDGAPADGDASVTGMNGDEAQNGIMNGSAGGGDERESDASPEVGQVRAKKKPLNSDSDDPTGTPVRFNKKKRRDDPSQETVSSMSDDGASPVKVEPAASLADMKTEQSDSVCDVKMEPSDEFEMKTEPGGPVAEVKAEPSDGSELGLVIAAVEPLSQMSGSEPVAAKTEPDATASDKSESAAGAAEDSRPVSPLRDDSPVDESTSVDANPESQNDNDRLKLLLTSSDDEDADDPAADGAGVPNGGVDGDDMEDSASTVIRNGNERQRGADSPSSDEDSRGGRKLRKRTAKEKPPNSDSDATDPGDKNSHGRQRRTLKKSAGSDSERDDSERRSRRRRVGPKPEVSGSSADSVSVSDSAEEQRTERRRDRKGRRRPRGPPEPTADCSVSLTRLPPEMEREAADNGFVKITKRAKKQLSKQALEVRRLANVASLLRTSLMKGESSSEDSDDSDTEEDEKARKVKKSAARSTEKSCLRRRRRR